MPQKKMFTFEAALSLENFKTLLESLSRRGVLGQLANDADVKIVSRLYSENNKRFIWMIAATPSRIMRLRDTADERRAEASRYAENNESIRSLLRQEYIRTKNRLDEEYRDARKSLSSDLDAEYAEVEKGYSAKLEELNRAYEKRLKQSTQDGNEKHEYYWKRYLRYLGQFNVFQSKYNGGVWFEVYDFSSTPDGVTVDVIFSCRRAELFEKDTVLNKIADLVVSESGGKVIKSETRLNNKQRSDKKGKQGPRRYSQGEKMKAVLAWEKLDRDQHAITLEEFLEETFGFAADGILNVARSTFYAWRTKAKKDGLIPDK